MAQPLVALSEEEENGKDVKKRALSRIRHLPIGRDIHCYVPPCPSTDILAVGGGQSYASFPKGCVCLMSCPKDASWSGWDWQSRSVGEDRSQAPGASDLVWSGAQGCLSTPSDTKL